MGITSFRFQQAVLSRLRLSAHLENQSDEKIGSVGYERHGNNADA